MSGREGDLSPKQKETLAKFRETVSDVLTAEHDDHYLLRWLRARSFDIKKSEKMLRDHLKFREQWGVDTTLKDWETPRVLREYYPGGLFGHDKEGSPIWIETLGYADVKGILHSSRKSDIIRMKILVNETISKDFKEQTKKLGKRVDGLVVILDMEKYGLKHLWKPAINTYQEIIKTYEANYPETLKKSYIINAPSLLPIVFNLVKPLISEDTTKKVNILGRNWKQHLLEDIDADQLPVHWGGTATDPDGDPYCRSKVNMGGEVPKEYYLPTDDVDTEGWKTETIGRSSSFQVDYEVETPGTIISWQFMTDADIGFGVFRRTSDSKQKAKDMEEIIQSERSNSHMVPEEGNVKCKTPGTYVLRFDNTYSWLTAKRLSYSVQVLPPGELDSNMHTSPSFAFPPEELSGI